MGRLDHQFMNELEPFKTVNPSAENVAKYFYDEITRQLKGLPPGARVTDVILWETDTSRAQYRPGAIVGLKTGEAMNRAFFIIIDPRVARGGGLRCCSAVHGNCTGVSRLIVAMILFLGMVYWLSRRSGRRENPDRT